MGLSQKLSLLRSYCAEYIVTGIFGVLPTPVGAVIRNIAYAPLFKEVSISAYIQPSVRLIGVRNIEIGKNVRINKNCYISSKGDPITLKDKVHLDNYVDIRAFNSHNGAGLVLIGEHTYVGPYVCIRGRRVTIGKNCMIASHSSILANNHRFDSLDMPIREQGWTTQGVNIGDDCWIGAGVRILDGVTIGRGSVIGAGAVVNRDIPPYSIAVGVPAKVIRQRADLSDPSMALSAASN